MTREEIIERLRTMKAAWMMAADTTPESRGTAAWAAEAIDCAIFALKGPTREQVEKMRGEWITKHYVDGILEGTNFDECSKCGYQRVFENPELKTKYMFCPGCGRAMWDEAVDMVMERLEEVLKDGN